MGVRVRDGEAVALVGEFGLMEIHPRSFHSAGLQADAGRDPISRLSRGGAQP